MLKKKGSRYERNFEKSEYRQQLDSLIEKYGDLPEAKKQLAASLLDKATTLLSADLDREQAR